MTPAPDFADIASRAAARGIMVTAAGVEEIAGMLGILDRAAGEAQLRAWRDRDPDAKPDGTKEGLATCAAMLETWGPECFPANGHGQVDFARAMMDATASEIRAFLAASGAEA